MNKKARIFGLDVGTRNFEVLGRILASILGVLGRSWGRLGASWAPLRGVLGPTLAPKYLHKRSHTAHQKKYEKPESQKLGSAAWDLTSGDVVKQPIPRKASLNIEENAHPANMA